MLFLQGVSVKKYNFLDEPPDDEPFEMDEGPKGLSPAAKRLVVINYVDDWTHGSCRGRARGNT